MHIPPATIVINHFGGVRKTARALGRSATAVSHWQDSGLVPQALHKKVLKVLGNNMSAHDLVYGRNVKKQ